ncbi:membrane-associated progesterone receptor component 1 [Plakobranchus ocellatus]|uniref:Membrane-associated progesterone receptor component 1 n=1 Tax=Plakobranchus ocellatus TaxID=259542 RepID=A0AAV4BEZ8_9GAST|nr:membrane-associated progesterone receptor component 1 [Plakobranchus ocellatus]
MSVCTDMEIFCIKVQPLLVVLLLMVSAVTSEDSYTLKEISIKAAGRKPVRIFTAEELKKYDASDKNEAILMGIKGVVFDVTEGKTFYDKESPYNILVGKDSTRAVAKMSLEPSDMTHDISGLPPATLKALDDVFEGTYMAKYPVVGYMDYLLEEKPYLFKSVSYTHVEL